MRMIPFKRCLLFCNNFVDKLKRITGHACRAARFVIVIVKKTQNMQTLLNTLQSAKKENNMKIYDLGCREKEIRKSL